MVDIDWSVLSMLDPKPREIYLLLVKEYGDRAFTSDELESLLRMHGENVENIYKYVSELRKNGLIEVNTDPHDRRRKIYRLVFKPWSSKHGIGLSRDELIKLCKSVADLIRTAVDYKVILLFLFYKAVSDKWLRIARQYEEYLVKEKDISAEKARILSYIRANSKIMKLYDSKNNRLYTWHEIVKTGEIPDIVNALIWIAEANNRFHGLKKLVEVTGLSGLLREDMVFILRQIINKFNQYDLSYTPYDIIGEAYQWILAYFAPQKAKEGETYTPKEVIRLLVELLDIEDNSIVVDPACGSGSMLIEAYNYVREKTGGEPRLELYGQERNSVMAIIAKMNMALHGIMKDYEIYEADSLVDPRFGEADYILANPPWNQDGYGEDVLRRAKTSRIYRYGYPPNNTADWAWIQLMLYYARRKVGVVIDNGALFRGGREKSIRGRIVEEDLVEAVILLPEKLFYNVQAPGVIIIFNRNKPPERKGKILFINAGNEYEKHPEVRRLNRLGKQHIEKIVKTYREFRDIEGFSRIVDIKEVRENDYNLNVTLYVTPPLETEEIDLEKELQELLEIEKQAIEARKKALQYIQQVIQANKQR